MEEAIQKKVDQDWKSQVSKEKGKAQLHNTAYHEASFKLFVSSLGMQAMIAMGKLQNPATDKVEKNIEQARFLIDTLGILKEKTEGNLTAEEQAFFDDSLFNLRMMYVEEKGVK